jgi:hypothetical protein
MIALVSTLLLSLFPGASLASTARHFGAWYFVANGVSTKPNTQDPIWLSKSVTMASLAFISPSEIQTKGVDALPEAFKNHATKLRSEGIEVLFSIGGAAFSNDWTWLSSSSAAKAAAQVCANWSLAYDVGIEIDYEGNGDYSVNNGVVSVGEPLLNLGVFIEEFRRLVPFGTKALTMDVYASQGGGPGLTYLINSYLADMPTENPSWVKSGSDKLIIPGLDWINIMVAGGDDASEIMGYIQGYAGPNANVATQWNTERITAPVPASRAMISMIASNHCGSSVDTGLQSIISYLKSGSQGADLKGIMFWAVAPFGCEGSEYDPVLKIGDWDCNFNNACPAFELARNELVSAFEATM